MNQNVNIRACRPADLQPLFDIWLSASRVGHPFLNEADLASQGQLVRDIYLPKAENWVAECDGQPVGFIGLLDNFIGGLFVTPAAHGLGLGSRLIEHAASIKGDLDVEIYADNPMAPGFYGRNGFVEIERRPTDDEGRPLTIIRMRRKA